jgi:hypothetical protein
MTQQPNMVAFERVAIVGLGLIGGSQGFAIRRRRIARVVGVSRWGLAAFLCGMGGQGFTEDVSPSAKALEVLRTGAVSLAEEPTATADELEDPHALLTYASVHFYQGQVELRDSQTEAAEATFREVERALTRAILRSELEPDGAPRRLLRGQAAYLLGDLYAYVFKDLDAAKAFYEAALRHVPTHVPATNALGRLLIPPPAPDATTP